MNTHLIIKTQNLSNLWKTFFLTFYYHLCVKIFVASKKKFFMTNFCHCITTFYQAKNVHPFSLNNFLLLNFSWKFFAFVLSKRTLKTAKLGKKKCKTQMKKQHWEVVNFIDIDNALFAIWIRVRMISSKTKGGEAVAIIPRLVVNLKCLFRL